jgi:uncharacterized protein (DUF433 family)
MSALPITVVVPLFTDTDGAIRVRGTRVLLDVIVTAFLAGATADEIAQKFPTLALADVYQIIAYYLNNTAAIDSYVAQRQAEAAVLENEMKQRFNSVGLRARLLARQEAMRGTKHDPAAG